MAKNRLAILPNLTHYEVFLSPALVPAVLPFLNGESAFPAWKWIPKPGVDALAEA